MTKGPPSSGQHVSTGSRSSRGVSAHFSITAPARRRFIPMRAAPFSTSRALHSFAAVGGSAVCASSTARLMNGAALRPNARSARRAVPNRFVTSGKSAPFGFVKRSAGPPAAITRRWISAASRRGSTGASTTARSPSARSASRNDRRSVKRSAVIIYLAKLRRNMSLTLAESTLRDKGLEPIREKVLLGRRLTFEDGVALYNTHDLLGLGALANHVREKRHGDVGYFVWNTHINHTNVCVATCDFCAFSATPKDDPRAYSMSLDEIFANVDKLPAPVKEVHIVGGLHNGLPGTTSPRHDARHQAGSARRSTSRRSRRSRSSSSIASTGSRSRTSSPSCTRPDSTRCPAAAPRSSRRKRATRS